MIIGLSLLAGTALAQTPEVQVDAVDRNITGLLLFWGGAVLVMGIIGRFVFREQLNERRTIRALIDRIGPFFPEFDTDAIQKWVRLCAPHVWYAWDNHGNLGQLGDYATERCHAEISAKAQAETERGQHHEARLGRVLKVHPLGIYMIGDGPPPADVELMLRIEFRAIDCVRDGAGRLVEGKTESRQVQYFWTLRHDGHQWRLDHIEPALNDITDLAKRPPVPAIMKWRRPKPA